MTATLLTDFGLDELCEQHQGFLPPEIAGFDRYDLGNPFLHDAQLGSTRHRLQRDGRLHDAREVRVVELVRIADPFVRYEFEILAAERVALLRGEIRERHPERAANRGIQVLDRAREAVRRKPLGHRIGIQESPVDALRRGPQDAVKTNSAGGHDARSPWSFNAVRINIETAGAVRQQGSRRWGRSRAARPGSMPVI